MVALALQNKFEEARIINNQLIPVYKMLFAENNPAGVKAFLAKMGIIQNELRLPLVPVSEALHKKIMDSTI
jgi:4-hydroxy-tetrahydrodipicolinate synthase